MDELTQAIRDMPITGLIPAGLLIIVGLMLWAAGRRVLRAGFAMAGLIVGGAIGWLLGSTLQLGVSPLIVAIVIGLLLACIAALVYRLAIAGALAIVCGVAAPLAVVTVAQIQGLEGPPASEPALVEPAPADEPDEFDKFFGDDKPVGIEEPAPAVGLDKDDLAAELDLPGGITLPDGASETIDQARDYAEQLIAAFKAWWLETPEQIRPTMIGAAIAGALAGLLFGTLASSFSAAVVSAFGGSLLWLSSLRVLLAQLGEPMEQWLPSKPTNLLVLWLIVSLLGVAIQWMFRPKPADKSS